MGNIAAAVLEKYALVAAEGHIAAAPEEVRIAELQRPSLQWAALLLSATRTKARSRSAVSHEQSTVGQVEVTHGIAGVGHLLVEVATPLHRFSKVTRFK